MPESPREPRALPSSCAQILLVEDNPGDARLTREVFEEGRLTNHLHVVSDGVEAIRFLRKQGPYASAPRPDLILLDLNLPRMDGREVLAEIKSDPSLQLIPVVVLTTSAAAQDIDTTYRLHANSFITKPVDLDQFIAVVRSIESFWLTIVKLPYERP
ncbi:MAG: response regulator [Acidobacteriota bacterium]